MTQLHPGNDFIKTCFCLIDNLKKITKTVDTSVVFLPNQLAKYTESYTMTSRIILHLNTYYIYIQPKTHNRVLMYVQY